MKCQFLMEAKKNLITIDKEIDTADLEKAVYVMALLRIREGGNSNTLELMKKVEDKWL